MTHLSTHRPSAFAFGALCGALLLLAATTATAQPAAPAKATPEQRKFVDEQLAKLKVEAVFTDDTPPPDPKDVVDALVKRGKDVLPALREALPHQKGKARDACLRAITLVSWGFDPVAKAAEGASKLIGGQPLPAGATPKPPAEPAIARALPTVGVYELTFGPDPQSARPTGPIEPLKRHNYVLLARDGSVTVLSTPKAVDAHFKAARKPATKPAVPPAPAVDEQAVRDLLTAWLTMTAVTATEGEALTWRAAPETFTVRRNGLRWVAVGRCVPNGAGADKAGQRQLSLVLNADGTIVSATEAAGLKPAKK